MKKKFNLKKLMQGNVILTFDNKVYHVIDSKNVVLAGKIYQLSKIEPNIRVIKSNGRDIAYRDKIGAVLYEK